MDWTELYPFLFGIGLIAAVMLAYGLGLHVGKRQERVAISRKRWKQKQFLIGRHQTEREQYLEKIRFLKKELGRISQESADYQQKLDDIASVNSRSNNSRRPKQNIPAYRSSYN